MEPVAKSSRRSDCASVRLDGIVPLTDWHSLLMAEFPKVVGAGEVALVYEGVQLGVLSVELWDDRVVVQTAGVPIDESSAQRERTFQESQFAWARAYAASPDDPPARPVHPLGADHEALTLGLADTNGTSYRTTGAGGSGGGWEFTYAYRFEPPVPDGVAALRITFSIDGGPEATVEVPLGNAIVKRLS
jgi:hypothetical protein